MRQNIFITLLFAFSLAYAQDRPPLRVMFYNVENLFDIEKDSCKQDGEFLPESTRAWNYGRYKKKLRDLSRVITAVGEWSPPTLVGVCEVENDRVMRDLTKYSPLKEHGYRYVMTDSPDNRGIDVALMYQRDQFKLIGTQSLRLDMGEARPTRDILHATGIINTQDTLDVFVAHFPSRSQGQKETEPNRIIAAKKLRAAVDSLFTVRQNARIIIMGDLNDYPNNKSVTEVLNANAPDGPVNHHQLYHLMAARAKKAGYGSYRYQGEWGLLDHLIVSGLLLDNTSHIYTSPENAEIVTLPFLYTTDEKYGGQRPFRTYLGMKYEGGFSDHLPVYFDIVYGK